MEIEMSNAPLETILVNRMSIVKLPMELVVGVEDALLCLISARQIMHQVRVTVF